MIEQLVAFLRDNRDRLTRRVTVLKPHWDPTFGQGDPTETEIEIVDLDALFEQMDEFSKSFKETK